LAGKQPRPARFKTPDEFPSLRGKYQAKLDYEGKVVQSCMHCHQVRDAERRFFRDDRKPIPDEVLYPFPMPDAIALSIDSKTKAGRGVLSRQNSIRGARAAREPRRRIPRTCGCKKGRLQVGRHPCECGRSDRSNDRERTDWLPASE